MPVPDFTGLLIHPSAPLTPLWLIALLPLLGALANLIFGRRLMASAAGEALTKRLGIGSLGVTAIGVGSVALAFALVAANAWHLFGLEPSSRYLYDYAWQMIRIGSLNVDFAFAFDTLSATMALVITGVGTLIHVYSAAYMAKDPGYSRFFSYLNLFIFAMLLLVLGDNLIVMFFGWEGVGLASYLLIGYWYKDSAKASAGRKAFIVNRVGDVGFVVGSCLLFWGLGGSWTGGTYYPAEEARFVAVAAPSELSSVPTEEGDDSPLDKALRASRKEGMLRGATGTLSFTAYPGAKLYTGLYDGAALQATPPPAPFAVSPVLAAELPVGLTSLAIIPGGSALVGGGYDAALVRPLSINPGETTTVALVGSTLTFREMDAQLSIRDAEGKPTFRDAFVRRQIGGVSIVTWIIVAFLIAAAGKSAQLPLYVWLPDAMAGPTPVSALIHAATMVTAGVYLLTRMSFLLALSPTASGIIAIVGALTALFAASVALYQTDIKKVLAYSTISQLGFMFIGVGVGAYAAAIFHLVTHAIFKACLFLAAGSVIHGMHAVEHEEADAQDLRKMGGLRRVMPKTAIAYGLAAMAISAAPIPFFSGFWSKDAILFGALTTENTGVVPGWLLYGLGLAAAACTSLYIWRSYYLAFEGPHAKAKIASAVGEPPGAMLRVTLALASLSVVAGVLLGLPPHLYGGHGPTPIERWLRPAFSHAQATFTDHGSSFEVVLAAVAVGVALLAWGSAKSRYGRRRDPKWAIHEQRLLGYELLAAGYHVDALYKRTFVRAFDGLARLAATIDARVIDASVLMVGAGTRLVARVSGRADLIIVDGAVRGVADGTVAAGERLRRVQTGRVQTAIYAVVIGVAALALLNYWLR